MEAKELRIGNYVRTSNEGYDEIEDYEIHKIECIQTTELFDDEATWLAIDGVEPIKITEEWLKEFGFEEEFGCLKKGLFESMQDRYRDEVLYCSDVKLKHIKYVHQLQNVYYSVTGNELEKK